MRTNELKINQLNFEAPNKTVKLSAVAAAALHTNIDVSEILDKTTESFKDFGEGQYNTYILAKLLGVNDNKISKNILPEWLTYLKINPGKGINNYSYNNTVPLAGKAA